ncbi:hypothetical protein [Aurantimonas sp. HBX-1]|uniref:hypothetical protein n=1 Tax=Aurantimonas sp. HBX-1 TaxID=2906072 RepID=UPI001F29FB66|nr:hypothetical protein [Aurantimonas sp. HBX-1]UIJ73950.1 hypothetical protein LXB15_10215 [Aurantimonas sp. HBX-1]
MSAPTRHPQRLIAASLGGLLAMAGSGLAQVSEPAADVENPARLVEVSLGDWGVKTALARDLAVGIADVPLTVAVPEALAAEVCPVSDEDLEQQEVISPTRTCAAKSLTDGLRDEVRKQVQPQ